MKLENKVTIITGDTREIGYRIVGEYLKGGAKITVCSGNAQEGMKIAKELGKLGEVPYLQVDASSIEDDQMLVDKTVKRYGRLDIFIANAGVNDPDRTHYLYITEERCDRILSANLKELLFGSQLVAKQMIRQGWGGTIVNISSVNAHLTSDNQICYTTNKGGVNQLIKVQTVVLTPYDIKVDTICPGPIESKLMRRVGLDERLFNMVIFRTLIDRIGAPNKCRRLAVFPACNDSSSVYRQSIYIDDNRNLQAFPVSSYRTAMNEQYEELMELE